MCIKQEILSGLRQSPKRIASKFFYDEEGDRLFQKIMQLDAYYLPGAEREIIAEKSEALGSYLKKNHPHFEVVELGAGSGVKTVNLLRGLRSGGLSVSYYALDISPHILKINEANIKKAVPEVEMYAVPGNYFKTFPEMELREVPRLVLFLGANIGNYSFREAAEFLREISGTLRPGKDFLIVAFDLKKDPQTILRAYNDEEGVTRAFNLNLLHRFNREFNADFDPESFTHYPHYDPVSGLTYSYLISTKAQTVSICDENISFEAHEPIHTEISKKYSFSEIENLAAKASLHVTEHFTDSRNFYTLSLFTPDS